MPLHFKGLKLFIPGVANRRQRHVLATFVHPLRRRPPSCLPPALAATGSRRLLPHAMARHRPTTTRSRTTGATSVSRRRVLGPRPRETTWTRATRCQTRQIEWTWWSWTLCLTTRPPTNTSRNVVRQFVVFLLGL